MYICSSERIIRDVAYICFLLLQKSYKNALYLYRAQKSSILCEGLQKCLRERVLALGCSCTNVFHSFQSFYENGYNFLKRNKSIWFEMMWTMQWEEYYEELISQLGVKNQCYRIVISSYSLPILHDSSLGLQRFSTLLFLASTCPASILHIPPLSTQSESLVSIESGIISHPSHRHA